MDAHGHVAPRIALAASKNIQCIQQHPTTSCNTGQHPATSYNIMQHPTNKRNQRSETQHKAHIPHGSTHSRRLQSSHTTTTRTLRVRMASPSRLHKRTVLSPDAEAMVLPSGEKATLLTKEVWPYSGMRGIRHSLVHTPHTERVAGPCAGAPTTVPQHPTAPTGMAPPHGGTQCQTRIKFVKK